MTYMEVHNWIQGFCISYFVLAVPMTIVKNMKVDTNTLFVSISDDKKETKTLSHSLT